MLQLFDWHCDLLCRCENEGIFPNDATLQGGIFPLTADQCRVQACAVFLKDGLPDPQKSLEAQMKIFKDYLQRDAQNAYLLCPGMQPQFGKTGCFLTLENAGELAKTLCGDASTVAQSLLQMILKAGFVAVSLTWNGQNPLGGGADTDAPLTETGLLLAQRLIKAGILLDVSHLNERGFWQLAELKLPLIATHSNAKAVCSHRRNLSDAQLGYIFAHGGVVGLNFHAPFLGENLSEDQQGASFVLAHMAHMVALGGQKAVVLGSDWDGGAPCFDLNSPKAVANAPLFVLQSKYIQNGGLWGSLATNPPDCFQNALQCFCRCQKEFSSC